MKEAYLPIKESVGYNNIKNILNVIFSIDLDDIDIREGEDENFAFEFIYFNTEINIVVSATGKSGQFNVGEGGLISILLPNPNYPFQSFLPKQFIESIIDDEHVKSKVRHLLGKRKSDVHLAFQLLKDYLDEQSL